MDCLQHLNYKVNAGSVPVVWFSMNDLIEHEVVDEKVIKPLNKPHIVTSIARAISRYLWDGETLGEMWHNAMEDNINIIETLYVESVKDKNLPLIDINSLKTDDAKNFLEKRLKGTKDEDSSGKVQEEDT
jgi:hypothetical protein